MILLEQNSFELMRGVSANFRRWLHKPLHPLFQETEEIFAVGTTT